MYLDNQPGNIVEGKREREKVLESIKNVYVGQPNLP